MPPAVWPACAVSTSLKPARPKSAHEPHEVIAQTNWDRPDRPRRRLRPTHGEACARAASQEPVCRCARQRELPLDEDAYDRPDCVRRSSVHNPPRSPPRLRKVRRRGAIEHHATGMPCPRCRGSRRARPRDLRTSVMVPTLPLAPPSLRACASAGVCRLHHAPAALRPPAPRTGRRGLPSDPDRPPGIERASWRIHPLLRGPVALA